MKILQLKHSEQRRKGYLSRIACFAVFILTVLTIILAAANSAQAATSTYFIRDDATGGDCASIGVWDPSTKTCTMTSDLTIPANASCIDISSDGITLDGNGHNLWGVCCSPDNNHGVVLSGRTGITLKNLVINSYFNNIYLINSNNNAILNNTLTGFNGIIATNSSNNIVYGNNVTAWSIGVDISGSGNNLTRNVISSDNYGIGLNGTNNTFVCNTVSNAAIATFLDGSDNSVYNNNFLNNTTDGTGPGGPGYVYYLPTPTGGNYWSNYDTPAEGCEDLSGDGFCDAPFVFSGSQDDLPWTAQSAWPPTVFNVQPSGTIYSSAATISAFYAHPSGINTTSVAVTLDGTALSGCTVTGWRVSCPVSNLSYGPHAIGGSVSSNDGKTSPISGSFAVGDNVAPVVIYAGPSGATQSSSATITATYTDAAPSSGLDATSATVSLNGGTPTVCEATGGNISCQVSGLAIGNYSAVVSIRDNAGNIGSSSGSFSVSGNIIDATGGRCSAFGTWDAATKTCTLTSDVAVSGVNGIEIAGDGITLNGNGHSVSGNGTRYGVFLDKRKNVTIKNLSISSFSAGVYLYASDNNAIVDNSVLNNINGIHLKGSSNNTLRSNSVDSNTAQGFLLEPYYAFSCKYFGYIPVCGYFPVDSNNNKIFNNNLINNLSQVIISSGTGNVFNNPETPNGGNFWSNHDTPAEGCDDANDDGFCDASYNFGGGQDNKPWAIQNGWIDIYPPTVTSVQPSGNTHMNSVNIRVDYLDKGNGVNPASVSVTLDGYTLSGCTINAYYASCSTTVSAGAHAIGGSITDYAGHTNQINGSFNVGPIHIRDNATGGDCQTVGTWTSATKTCLLNTNITIEGSFNGIEMVDNGVTLDGNGHTMSGNIASDKGVFISGRTGVSVRNLDVQEFYNGIYLQSSSNVTLSGNTASQNVNGLIINASSGSQLSSNTATGNYSGGLLLNSSSNSLMTGNSMIGNQHQNFVLLGSSDTHYDQNINTSNQVDGKPVYYVKNVTGQNFGSTTNAGVFYCINCNNVTISNISLSTNGHGVFLWKTRNSTLDNIYTAKNGYGIYLGYSDGNTIRSSGIVNNNVGIQLYSSNNNTIASNSVKSNNTGISLDASTGNTVYRNIIDSNTTQAKVTGGSGNSFNQDAPTGGNYWSNWASPDSDHNGFVDSAYVFSGGQDSLPLSQLNKPILGLGYPQAFWASAADYINGQLSISWTIFNNGSIHAYNVEITSSGNSHGVSFMSQTPVSVGNIPVGGSASVIVKYLIPAGVNAFISRCTGRAQDAYGTTYVYP